ncbi:MAG: cardiolipin synthase ClsB [Zoogloeaceae bacterium]|jgi:cardiolipin synthase|nr:cardiolipin synthase ClsB [Zoogloeaceae bacterium]
MTEFLEGHRLVLLNSGRDYFPALLEAIEGATREIFLETYIFANDAAGQAVAVALMAAARRGVAVRVLVDGFGARRFPEIFGPALAAAGAHYKVYRREIARFSPRRHSLRRLHRKLVVIDGRVAFVGGINIIDDASPLGPDLPSYDYAVRVEGPLLSVIHRTVARMWTFQKAMDGFRMERDWRNARPRLRPDSPPPVFHARGCKLAFLLRDNLRHRNTIANAYLAAIREARHTILIANAYFLPGFRFRRALRNAARRGTAVTVLLQGESDHRLFRYATQAIYGDLLADGIRVFEYRGGFLHAKVAVIDGHWATVGSSNIDPFSLFLAREANVAVKDTAFAAELASSLTTAMREGAVEWTMETHARQPFHLRLLRRLSYELVKFLVNLAGYGHEDRKN